ncbi:hypothetical protein ACGFNP_27745 [Nonomuraea sp. NPDC049269]|uniref:hypothetical protein n=1 Tax=Nonomuraea sp. NPDC049269 TaxID=3364349 RepID=UPI003722A0D5
MTRLRHFLFSVDVESALTNSVSFMIVILLVVLGIPTALVCGSIFFATLSAPRGRWTRMSLYPLAGGAVVATFGIAVMALTAWSTQEDKHYDDFDSALIDLAGIFGGALLIFGLGPFVPWLLGLLRRPADFLPAVRHVCGAPARTAAGVATTMAAAAVATALMIIAPAMTAQGKADYYPDARPGALVVEGFSAGQTATVRAAIQYELPGVPIAEKSADRGPGFLNVGTDYGTWPDPYIGDQALLRYLTGDPSTPYDKGTAVVVSTDNEETDSAEIRYSSSATDGSPVTKAIPKITIRPPDPRFGRLFIPREMVQDLGFQLQPDQFIIDPSHYHVSATEQERLDRRLGGIADTYVEQGYQAPTEWLYVVTLLILIALAGALAATRSAGSARILLRISGGSVAALRFLISCRAAVGAACGTAIGATAGCAIGLFLVWPMTTSIDWDPPPRAPFETPWTAIAIPIASLPVLAAVIAALVSPTWLIRSARTSIRGPLTAPEPQKIAPTSEP